MFRTQLKAAGALGVAAFVAPFLGCTALAYFGRHWPARAAWLCGIALSTTSVAVVYTVMLELGLNKTEYGKMLLAGLSHGIIDQTQYSYLVGTVIASAVIPTLIGNFFWLPRHLISKRAPEEPAPAASPSPLAPKEAT